ncbi:MAG: prepilin peptidase [Alphaproteobacteria bacterium]|nr:prepilin peptidase [Alphaproteobacteria bacterium]
MLEIIAILSLIGGLIILYFLSSIDLKTSLLPNELVLGFASFGLVFHLCSTFTYLDMSDMLLGGFIGGGILYIIRILASMFYQDDALGLGDVKLLIAAGIWLGSYYVLIALTLGALAGIAHGLGLAIYNKAKTGKPIKLGTLSLPAGPGFAIGIILTAIYMFKDFPKNILESLF